MNFICLQHLVWNLIDIIISIQQQQLPHELFVDQDKVHSKSLHALHHFSDLFLDDERININHYILCIKYFHSYYTINESVYIWGTFWRHFPMTNINQSTWCYVPSLVEFWEGSFECIKCIPQTHNCIGGRSISCSFIHLYQSKGESYIIYGVFTDKFILTDYIPYLPKIRFFYLLYFFLSIKYKGKQTIDYCFIT